MFRQALAATTILLAPLSAFSQPITPVLQEVDLELVLAADASGSVSSTLNRAQKLGFAKAFRDPDLQSALASGPLGKVAVIYFEWAGATEQHVVVPWTVLESAEDIAEFANRLEYGQTRGGGGETSISGALLFAERQLNTNGYNGLRRVVDIASNGMNSDGPPVSVGLQTLRAHGVIVNALVLPSRTLDQTGPYAILFEADAAPLDDYFRTEVIAGPGAFVHAVDLDVGFAEAILRKLVLEVTWLTR
jgi:hypothetical protein